MGSPVVEVKDGGGAFVDTPGGVNVTQGNTISIQLKTPGGVTDWYLEVFGVDEVTATAPALTGVDGFHHVTSPATIVTFTMPAGVDIGRAIVIRSTVDSGGPGQTITFGIFTLTGEGERVGAVGETFEGNSTFGWVAKVNPLIRAAAGGGGGPVDDFAGLDVTSEHRADSNIEAGVRVARWPDLRSYNHWVTFERDLALWYAGNTIDAVITDLAATTIRKGPIYSRSFDADGPAVMWPTESPQGGLWCRTPLVYDMAEFTIAFRIWVNSANGQTLFSQCTSFPGAPADAPKMYLSWTYTSGGSGTLHFSLTDGDSLNVEAMQTMTHGAWHNVILRHTGTSMLIRVDGVNGSAEATAFADLTAESASIGCEINAIDGTAPGFATNGTAIRHIVTAQRAWSDAECLTAEAVLTAEWT